MANKSQLRRTLEQTQKSLEKAVLDLQRAQKKVQSLTQKIPELQRAVDSMRVLCGEKPKPRYAHISEVAIFKPEDVISVPQPPIPNTSTTTTGIPPEIAARMPKTDLSGMGSIPATQPAPTPEPEVVDVDEPFLPPIEGEPVVGE